MEFLEAILIILIIIISYWYLSKKGFFKANKLDKSKDDNSKVDNSKDDTSKVNNIATNKTPVNDAAASNVTKEEKAAFTENIEYFNTCGEQIAQNMDGCVNSPMTYAINAYGMPGADYTDWVKSQAVDPQVISNHTEFVQDRLGDNQLATGRTYSPDSNDSYEPIPWQGLRRPQAVPVCNPTQVPDVDYNLYESKTKLKW